MGSQGGHIELKWDGSPVIYWGRDHQGAFHMYPKNAWEYLKRGTTHTKNGVGVQLSSPEDVVNFILGTGKEEVGKEKERHNFARGMADLWPYFESISPEKGYIEGGILFSPFQPPVLNPKTGEYDFKPNITTFHIPANSDLGTRIANAKLMVAATGYYADPSSHEARYENAEQLSTPTVIVQGTTYVEESPGTDQVGLDKVENYIQQHAAAIDSFLEGQQGLSNPGDVLYKFFNQNLRVAGVKSKFTQWVKEQFPTGGKAQKILSHPGLANVLAAVEMLTIEKMKLIQGLSQGTHGGIRQTKPEGYVQAHPGTPFKNDLPGQFVKTIDQANWAPRKN
jgi:hypothetical protein